MLGLPAPSRRWLVGLAIVLLASTPMTVSSATPKGGGTFPHTATEARSLGDVPDLKATKRLIFSTSEKRFDEGVDNQGWWSKQRHNYDANDNYLLGECDDCGIAGGGYFRYRNFFTFDLSQLEGKVIAARLVVRRYQAGGDITEVVALYNVRTGAARLNNNKGMDPAIYRDLGHGARYGRFRVAVHGDPHALVGFWLNNSALTDINAARGGYFSIGGTLTSAPRSDADADRLFFKSRGRGVQELRLWVEPT